MNEREVFNQELILERLEYERSISDKNRPDLYRSKQALELAQQAKKIAFERNRYKQ